MSPRNERLLNLLAENRLKEVVEYSVKKAINDALGGNCDNSENVMDIEFKNDSVCFAGGRYWSALGDGYRYLVDDKAIGVGFKYLIECSDFQLNTIKQGDYIESSELDSQKYNDAVEVFWLFGFEAYERCSKEALRSANEIFFASDNLLLLGASGCSDSAKRKLTYHQIMAIGELKRLEVKREKSNNSEKPNVCKDATNKQEVKMQKNKPVVAQVMIDLTERMEIGIKTYGEALRANNGRDALQDAYEEALDLACYLKQAMIERDNADTN